MKKLILILIVCTSCSQIRIKTVSSRHMTAESNGKALGGKAVVEYQRGTVATLDLSDDRTDNPLELEHESSSGDVPVTGHFEFGVHRQIDLFYKSSFQSAPITGVKFQILGKSRRDAKLGDNSLAVTLGYGEQFRSDEDDDGVFSDDYVEADIKHELVDASVIFSRRIEDDVVFYSSFQYTNHKVNLELNADSVELDGESYELKTDVYGIATGLVQYNGSFHWTVEVSGQNTHWNNNEPTTLAFVSTALGWAW